MPRHDLSSELARFRDGTKVPAVAAAVVSADAPDAFAVVGVRRRDGTSDAEPFDRWHVGSCAKALTAALYARLVEEGEAAWGVPVATLFPDLEDRMAPGWHERTVEDLLRCRSGMKADLSPLRMRASWADDSPLDRQRSEVALATLSGAPGRAGRFRYSNLGYVVAGAAIDRLAAMPYEKALQRYLLDPLSIRSVGYGAPPGLCGHHSRVRLGSFLALRGKPAEPDDRRSDNPPVLSSAGTLHLSMQDWSRFVRTFVIGGGGVLQAASIERLLEAPTGKGVPMTMGWIATPDSNGSSHVFQGSNTMWSATVMLDTERHRASLVACNDGRTSVLARSGALAGRILEG